MKSIHIYFTIVVLLILLYGCGSSFRQLSDITYAPHPKDYPIEIICSDSMIPGYRHWKRYFSTEKVAKSKPYTKIGFTWISAKTKYLEPDEESQYIEKRRDRMIKKGIKKLKNIARQKGADAVIDITFQGQYFDGNRRVFIIATSETYRKVSHLRAAKESLRGTLIRYTEPLN